MRFGELDLVDMLAGLSHKHQQMTGKPNGIIESSAQVGLTGQTDTTV